MPSVVVAAAGKARDCGILFELLLFFKAPCGSSKTTARPSSEPEPINAGSRCCGRTGEGLLAVQSQQFIRFGFSLAQGQARRDAGTQVFGFC